MFFCWPQGGGRRQRGRGQEHPAGGADPRGVGQRAGPRAPATLPAQAREGVGTDEQRGQRHPRLRLLRGSGEPAGTRPPQLGEDLRAGEQGEARGYQRGERGDTSEVRRGATSEVSAGLPAR